MIQDGFIKLPRYLYASPVLKNGTDLQVFILFLFRARFTAGRVELNGVSVNVSRGEAVFTRGHLARELNISEYNVRSSIERLKKQKLISIRGKGKLLSVVSILNFDDFQGNSTNVQPTVDQEPTNGQIPQSLTDSGFESGDILSSTKSQPKTNQEPTYKKKKEKKKENNTHNSVYEYIPSESENNEIITRMMKEAGML